jgi:phosphatidate cytidylyltransferase
MQASDVPLLKLLVLFLCLLFLGAGLTIPLYKFDIRKFVRSRLFIKILFWVPIFVILTGLLYASQQIRLAVLVLLMLSALVELLKNYDSRHKTVMILYFTIFSVFLGHFYFIGADYKPHFVNLLITIAFATVLADVTAFFLGNYLGKHKLPEVLNKNKSWEGVIGEVAGALLGVILVSLFVEPLLSVWLFVPIGLGSVFGDLANSFVKRRLKIKDWSAAIPGHGGFIDRLSSVAGSVALTFYYLKITGL